MECVTRQWVCWYVRGKWSCGSEIGIPREDTAVKLTGSIEEKDTSIPTGLQGCSVSFKTRSVWRPLATVDLRKDQCFIYWTYNTSEVVLRVQPPFWTSPSVLSLVTWRSWTTESLTVSHMAIYTLAVSMNVRVKLSPSDTLLMCQNYPGSLNVCFA